MFSDGANLLDWASRLPYSEQHAFQELNADKVYFASHVCVSREVRGQGLGSELIRRSHRLAEEASCSHTYILALSNSSQAMFSNLGYKVNYGL